MNREEFLKNVDELMPEGLDITLLVLRSHLFVEEEIQRQLYEFVDMPDLLDEASLTFYQKMRLVQSLLGEGDDDYLWKSVKQLNKLRNSLAHNLEVQDIENRVDQYLKNWAEEGFNSSSSEKERYQRIIHAVITTCSMLQAYRDTHRRIFGDTGFLRFLNVYKKTLDSKNSN